MVPPGASDNDGHGILRQMRHESPRTTKVHDRTTKEVSSEEIERIRI